MRQRIQAILDLADPEDRVSRIFDHFIMALIGLNVAAAIAGTVESISKDWGTYLDAFELFSVVVFSIEYVLRVWSCVESERFTRPILGRLRFILTPLAIIDILAIAPFYLELAIGISGNEARTLRAVRLVRIFRMGRYSRVMRTFGAVIRDKKEELLMTVVFMCVLLLVSATLIYIAERHEQPEHFSSIPASMWWAVTTLTTVGYGDVYPVTGLGRFLAAIIAVLGIGMFALPTGVLGAGFIEKLDEQKHGEKRCPHCGMKIE